MNLVKAVFGLCIALWVCACGAPADPDGYEGLVDLRDGPPNIVILALDTWRADHMGTYGNDWVLTPVLDCFANEAIVFDESLRPVVVEDVCIGCGLCDFACPTEPSAIPIVPRGEGRPS